jgi:F-type H+-transporting ATPase subunit alpha
MQQLNPSEISEIIKGRIDKLDVTSQARNEGTVVSVSDGIVRIHGLADVMYGEMIEFPGGVYGMALNLEQDSVGAVYWAHTPVWRRHERQVHRPHPGSSGW